MNFKAEVIQTLLDKHGWLFLLANATAALCTLVILFAIIVDFLEYHKPKENKRKTKSVVETGTMMLYFLGYFLLMQVKAGRISIGNDISRDGLVVAGTLLLLLGCYVNVAGRLWLKHNWANQVTIYRDQTLVTRGVYAYVRHPLYASLVWMFTGGALIYTSYLAFLSVYLVFLPMMFYRARQEEQLLAREFPDYAEYRKKTGMFFPRLFGKT